MGATIESEQTKAGRRLEKAEGLADIPAQAMLKEERNSRALIAVVEDQSVMCKARLQGGTECNSVMGDFKFQFAPGARHATDGSSPRRKETSAQCAS